MVHTYVYHLAFVSICVYVFVYIYIYVRLIDIKFEARSGTISRKCSWGNAPTATSLCTSEVRSFHANAKLPVAT